MSEVPKTLAKLCLISSLLIPVAAPSAAAEIFGAQLFGQNNAAKPAGISYSVEFTVDNDDGTLKQALSQSSLLVAEESKGASDIYSLLARARADQDQLTAALYTEARYGGKIEILVDGKPLDREPTAAEEGRIVPVMVRITPGPVFRFGEIKLAQTHATQNGPPSSPENYKLIRGNPARSDLIVAAIDRLVEDWRSSGYPFAQVASKDISADHARQEINVVISIDPGAPAVYGWVNVVGTDKLDSHTVAEQSAISPGKSFDPKDLRSSRERLRKLESIESVRIIEGEKVDANGGIPITLEVSERKPRYIGGTAYVSTLDGAEVSAYWGHRNLFGEGETLRVDGSVSRLGAEAFEDLEFDAAAVFEKPGIYDIDTKFFAEFRVGRDNPEPYDAFTGRVKAGVSQKFDPATTGSIAIDVEQSRIEDAFGTRHHTLLSTPAHIEYDRRDRPLDPTTGVHAIGRLSPVVDVALGDAFLVSDLSFAGYHPLDPEQALIFAGRIGAGSIAGATLSDVPASYRFFAGGSGTVRGYEYRSLGPHANGELVGGLSYLSGSAELRWRISQQFGLVPFIDAATVSESEVPNFSKAVYVGAGLGVRYYTSLGPLRFDFAVPLTERDDRSKFAVYLGLGQAF